MTLPPPPRFSANLAFLFTERPFLERFSAAAAAGFRAVECQFPYDHPAEEIARAAREAGVAVNGINAPRGTPDEWGRAALPGRERDFAADMDLALDTAAIFGAGTVHVMAGLVDEGAEREARAAFVANLKQATPLAERRGLILLTEPLNARDRPGYLVSRSDQAADIIAEVGAPNLRLLFDVYHVQIMEGDLLRRLRRHRPVLGHVQIAGVPDRGEPDRGEVHLPAVLAELGRLGYEGWIGCEYRPSGRTEDSLGWMRAFDEPAGRPS